MLGNHKILLSHPFFKSENIDIHIHYVAQIIADTEYGKPVFKKYLYSFLDLLFSAFCFLLYATGMKVVKYTMA